MNDLVVARSLEVLETIIERGQQTFVEVGNALMEIRDGQLYKGQGHGTFEDYCKVRWGWERTYAYRLMNSAQVIGLLPIGNIPTTESQARELVRLMRASPEQVAEAFQEVVAEHGDNLTAEKIRLEIDKRLSISEWYSPKEIEAQRKFANALPHVAHNSGENEWYTPPEYIETARTVMGDIDLDPASSEVANETVGAATYFDKEKDGLAQSWSGRVWMNPPYAADLIGRFCAKLVQHVKAKEVPEAIVLVNNATETVWFRDLISVATAIVFPASRIRFLDAGGKVTGAPLQGQALIYMGPRPDIFRIAFNEFGWGATL